MSKDFPPQKLSEKDRAWARLQNAPPLADVSEEERETRGRELFEYEGTKFRRFKPHRPFFWAQEGPDTVAADGACGRDFMRMGWIDAKGRRCISYIPKDVFRHLFVLVE